MIYTVTFLIVISLLSYYTLHQKEKTEEAITTIMENYNLGQIYAEFKGNNNVLWLFVVGGVLLTAGFAISYFSGGEIAPEKWTPSQWIFSGVGVVVTIAITVGQRTLYQDVSLHRVAFFITLIVLSFVYMSEIATTDERTESLVRTRSLESPTLNAVLGTIQTTTSTLKTNPYATQIAELQGKASEHQSKLAECANKYQSEKKRVKCEEYERAKASGYSTQATQLQAQANTGTQSQQNTVSGLVAQAKDLEFNEENHTAFIKFVKSVFGVSFESAQNFVAFILVNAFEVLFHFIGVRVGILREALLRMGYNLTPDPPSQDDINAELAYKRAKHRAKFDKKREKYEQWKPKKSKGMAFSDSQLSGAMIKPYTLDYSPKGQHIPAGYPQPPLSYPPTLAPHNTHGTPKHAIETERARSAPPNADGFTLDKAILEAVKEAGEVVPKNTVTASSGLYKEWLDKVKNKTIKHTSRAGRRFISDKLCKGKQEHSLTPQGMDALLNIWQLRAVKEGVLIFNPEYSNGKSKFILTSR